MSDRNWLRGTELTGDDQRHVLRAYLYRLTTENGYPAKNPCGARVAAVSDAYWMSTHCFLVRKNGRLDMRSHSCIPCVPA